MMQHTSELKKWLQSAKRNIVITTHFKPDGDALGSSLALYQYLHSEGHEVTVITPNDYPDFIAWLPGNELVIDCEKEEAKALRAFALAELIFSLDYNALHRTNAVIQREIASSTAFKVMIDHHLQPEDFADITISNVACGSTSEMVYDFVKELHGKEFNQMAFLQAVYVGIVTDTGQFNHSVNKRNLEIFSSMIEHGLDYKMVNDKVFNAFDENRLRFLGFAITERLTVFDEYKAACICISKDDLIHFKLKTGETEGLVNYMLKLQNVVLAALITDRTHNIKMSFRSKGNFDVNSMARAHFNGGGHKNASGGTSNRTLDEVYEQFKAVLPIYKEELLKV